MGRIRSTLLVTLALAGVSAPADARPLAKARMLDCVVGVEEPGRATFEGDMTRIVGATRMQMKFVLQAWSGSRWSRVHAPSTGQWTTSNLGVGRYVYKKVFENLVAPRNYRVHVHFRWLSAANVVLRRATRVSRSCRQPDQRPQLTIASIGAEHARSEGMRRYRVTVRNLGRLDAGPFGLQIEIGELSYELTRAEILLAGGHADFRGEAPACQPEDLVVVRVDPLAEVDERDERDNALTARCPLPQRG